jgi:transposase InsO family protein
MSSGVCRRCRHSLLAHVERYEEITDGTWCSVTGCDCPRYRGTWFAWMRRKKNV